MKKKLTAIFLCVALVAIAIVGASLAYFTDTKTATNTFTMGDVKIKLDETNVNDPEGDRVTSNEYNVYPGAVVTKDPIVHNVGQNAAYIRATVNVENWMNMCAAYFPDFDITYPNQGYEQSLMPDRSQRDCTVDAAEVFAGQRKPMMCGTGYAGGTKKRMRNAIFLRCRRMQSPPHS